MSTYSRKAHTRNVNGQNVRVRASKVTKADPRVAWLDALFSPRDRDDDYEDDDPGIFTVTQAGGGWEVGDRMCDLHRSGYSAGCMTCRSLA